MKLKQGTKVKMSEKCKQALIANNCKKHVDEFGSCVGLVEDLIWPDSDIVNVRWIPSKLRYGYSPEDLDIQENIENE